MKDLKGEIRKAAKLGITAKEMTQRDVIFIKCCAYAKVQATKRQAMKYRNQKGSAYVQRAIVIAELEKEQP